ncbi:hypothetical protein OG225_25810 [Nocardia sp. NBC_01377]|uniref:hypothetical protein n=1 Tax=Nocardia sp. NBC_01377 TaxID=2903595 RepID=UPI0032500DCB
MPPGVHTYEVREARKSEIDQIVVVLADGLGDDPLPQWLHPDPDTRGEQMGKGFRLAATQVCWKSGGVHVVVDTAGYELVAEVELPDTGPRSYVLCRETTVRQR